MKSALFFVFGVAFFGVCHADVMKFLEEVGEYYLEHVPRAVVQQGITVAEAGGEVWKHAATVWLQDDWIKSLPFGFRGSKQLIYGECEGVKEPKMKDIGKGESEQERKHIYRWGACTFFRFSHVKERFSNEIGSGPVAAGTSSDPINVD